MLSSIICRKKGGEENWISPKNGRCMDSLRSILNLCTLASYDCCVDSRKIYMPTSNLTSFNTYVPLYADPDCFVSLLDRRQASLSLCKTMIYSPNLKFNTCTSYG